MSRQLLFSFGKSISKNLKQSRQFGSVVPIEHIKTSKVKRYANPLPAKLYVVPIPIGNFEDITIRALRTLATVDYIGVPKREWGMWFLENFGIHREVKNVLSFGSYNEFERAPLMIEKLKNGNSVAIMTERGTPNLCDYGEVLINACIGIGIPVEALPGATAFVPALVASGIRTKRFVFEGQLPRNKKNLTVSWHEFTEEKRTIVFYEEAETLIKLMEELAEHLGSGRQCVIAQDISRSSEIYYRGTVKVLLDQLVKETRTISGQFVVIVQGTHNPVDFKQKEKEIKHERKLLQREQKVLEQYEDLIRNKKGISESRKQIYFPYG